MNKLFRKLARSGYWQNVYHQVKELGNLSIFKNNQELTKVQLIFLNWLNIYDSLYKDLALEEDYISEEVIENDLRTDAYLLWRKRIKNKRKNKHEEKENELGLPKVIFKEKGSK